MVLGEGRCEKAACPGLRARGRKTRGRLAAAQLIQSLEGCVKKFEPYLIDLSTVIYIYALSHAQLFL